MATTNSRKGLPKVPKAPKERQPREDRVEVYKTKVRFDLRILRTVIKDLRAIYDAIDPEGVKVTKAQRSAFNKWNTSRSFASHYDNGEDFVTLDVSGGTAGSSARIYHFPSVTSQCKEFRKCIVPVTDGNKFLFFDLKAAEFFMNCVFCQETEAVAAYQRGEDIYMRYKYLFPEGLPREPIKTVLISNMYGATPYSVALRTGLTENLADNLLRNVSNSIMKMTLNKIMVINYARKTNAYWCPNGLDQTNLIKVCDVDSVKGFNLYLALSAYVQSALGIWMKDFLNLLSPKVSGTMLSVFDSVLFEVKPESLERAKAWVEKTIAPFRTGDITVGDSFYEAYMGEEEE